jgi:DNA-binding transcriptional MocR family regulator
MKSDIHRLVQRLGNWTTRRGPLHRRLAAAIQQAVHEGVLPPGARLPAERALAGALAVSRTTVVTAYNTLRADGWLESRTGSGTWVSREPARRARHVAHAAVIDGSPLMDLLLVDERETIDFATGTPKPLADLPPEAYFVPIDLLQSFLHDRSYHPFGYPPLREAVARFYTRRGLPTSAGQVLVTSGAQQAISLVTSLFVQRSDTVLIETPAFFGALDVLRLAGARLVGVPVGPHHVQAAHLRDRIAAHQPRLIHLTPTCHNPTGAVMPDSTRREIAKIAGESGITVVEDGTLGELTGDDRTPAPIAACAGDAPVLTIGSMSKVYWAALRIGWVRGPSAMIRRLARVKSAADLGSPAVTQAIAVQLLALHDQAREMRRRQLSARRDVLAALVREHLPEWHFDLPDGGLFLWVRLPGVDARSFAQCAARHRVALTPGSLFSVDEAHTEYLRLPFLLDEPDLRLGVERLAAAWHEYRSHTHRAIDALAIV